MRYLLLFLLACACYARTIGFSFIEDDFYLIANNNLMNSWSSLPILLKTGYWQTSVGNAVPIYEFRPLTLLSFFLQAQTTGHAAWPFHLANALIHGACTLMLFLVLRKILADWRTALTAAVIFAVHPSHVDAVAHVSGRAEILMTLMILASWRFLLADRLAPALGCFALGLLSKENAAVFPAVWLLFDWIRRGKSLRRHPSSHIGLWAALAVYMAVRAAVLPQIMRVGTPYFLHSSVWVKWLTLSKFWFRYYLLPMITGANWALSFRRPFFPDANPHDAAAIALFLFWITGGAAAISACLRKRQWGFWMLLPVFFLLPTSHLIIPFDSLGAQRFLYFPSIAFCVAFAFLIERAGGILARLFPSQNQEPSGMNASPDTRRGMIMAAAAWYAVMTFEQSEVWRNPKVYYSAILEQNPLSANAISEMGLAHLQENNPAQAEADFRKAIELDPSYATPYYNLGKLLLERGQMRDAEAIFREADELSPGSPDVLDFLAIIDEQKGAFDDAIGHYHQAIRIRPWDIVANFNLGRLFKSKGDAKQAQFYWNRYLKLAPNDPESRNIRALLKRFDAARP